MGTGGAEYGAGASHLWLNAYRAVSQSYRPFFTTGTYDPMRRFPEASRLYQSAMPGARDLYSDRDRIMQRGGRETLDRVVQSAFPAIIYQPVPAGRRPIGNNYGPVPGLY